MMDSDNMLNVIRGDVDGMRHDVRYIRHFAKTWNFGLHVIAGLLALILWRVW